MASKKVRPTTVISAACDHPLFCFNQHGDLERALLRKVMSTDLKEGWRAVLEPIVARCRNDKIRRFFRGEAVFANPHVTQFLEAEEFSSTNRLPASEVL